MALTAGRQLASYEILGPLGAGGMGEVYRARDTRLGREVAIKILPPLLAGDRDRLSRFEREARTLASLNHPNIAQIYGIETADGVYALAMELVEGDDLSVRIARGRLPFDEMLSVARQVADGLEAAHELGIVHRDLKPANLKVRADGVVKILDFGLAKAAGPHDDGRTGGTETPTFTSPAMTEAGIILGTAAYMAPEQARGKPVDRRADIWAFGCVVYEMLTGRRPFVGDDVSMTLAALLKEPVDLSLLPVGTPPAIVRLLGRCLEKDPQKRLSAIGDARLDLDDARTELGAPAAGRSGQPARWAARAGWAGVGAVVAAALAGFYFFSRPEIANSAEVVRSQIALTPAMAYEWALGFDIDPSGTEIVFAGRASDQQTQLFLRRLDRDEALAVAGTEGASRPRFSPDGRWLLFSQAGVLKRMPSVGGQAAEVTPTDEPHGIAIAGDDSIILSPFHGSGLVRVASPGAQPSVVTTVDAEKGEAGHHWPHMLPDGRHLLFTTEIDGKPYSEARVELLSLDTGERRVLFEGGTDARYMLTGHIVYWRDGRVWSVAFDADGLEVTGPAVAVTENVMASENTGSAHFAVSETGTLVYLSGSSPVEMRNLMLVDRAGNARQFASDHRAYASVTVSPEGSRLATTIFAANDSIWIIDLERGSSSRVTFEAENHSPVWAPDGGRLALARFRGGEPHQLFVMPSDGRSAPERLRGSDRREVPQSWSAATNMLAFVRLSHSTGSDVWVTPTDGTGDARPWLETRFEEWSPQLSPDGRWMAYASDESGRSEVYVRAFPGPGDKRTISADGGTNPRWRADGREIYFSRGNAVLAADVTLGPSISVSVPRVLFRFSDDLSADFSWDVMPDGRTFVLIKDFSEPLSTLMMVQNWWTEVR